MHLLIGQGVDYIADWLDKRSVVCLNFDGCHSNSGGIIYQKM